MYFYSIFILNLITDLKKKKKDWFVWKHNFKIPFLPQNLELPNWTQISMDGLSV